MDWEDTRTAAPQLACPMCGGREVRAEHVVPELHFGTRETFGYLECADCGSWRIASVPKDLARHYPETYYSFDNPATQIHAISWGRRAMRRARTKYIVGGRGLFGYCLNRVRGDYRTHFRNLDWNWIRYSGAGIDSRILDVGCGHGALLLELREAGFSALTGVDPFAPREVAVPGLQVLRCTSEEVVGEFDLIMLHHSLEHMPDPVRTLGALRRHLAPQGVILIRVPLADCLARERYGVNWFQIDAPRHLFVPTSTGLLRAIERLGLSVDRVVYDSDERQFTVSEGYRAGIAYRDQSRLWHVPAAVAEQWRRESEEVNASGRGDQAAFYVRAL